VEEGAMSSSSVIAKLFYLLYNVLLINFYIITLVLEFEMYYVLYFLYEKLNSLEIGVSVTVRGA
jgi:hypothetical protein